MNADVIAIDTSALIAIACSEPECVSFIECITRAEQVLLSSSTLLEARVVVFGKLKHAGFLLLDRIVSERKFLIVTQDKEEIDLAYEAFLLYGKGQGHKAQLNFGDLFSYALAKSRGIPLLYKGEDFDLTDIVSAV